MLCNFTSKDVISKVHVSFTSFGSPLAFPTQYHSLVALLRKHFIFLCLAQCIVILNRDIDKGLEYTAIKAEINEFCAVCSFCPENNARCPPLILCTKIAVSINTVKWFYFSTALHTGRIFVSGEDIANLAPIQFDVYSISKNTFSPTKRPLIACLVSAKVLLA